MVVETVFAMMMIVNGSMDGFMKTDGLSHCLKVKRESERNLSESRTMLFVMNVVKLRQNLDQTAKVI